MSSIYLLLDNRGTEGGANYQIYGGFSDIQSLADFVQAVIKHHPDLAAHMYHEQVEGDIAEMDDFVYVIGGPDEPYRAFSDEDDALDWAEDWYERHPTGELYGFVARFDPIYE